MAGGPEQQLQDPEQQQQKGGAKQHRLPAWLKPERFQDPEFNAEAVVADLRRHVPLSVVKSELQAYLGALREQLVDVINADFGDYVALAPKLAPVDGAVVRMKQPLLDIRAQLDAVAAALRSELAALQQGLERRQVIAAARATLELMQEAAHVASKVEKLLAEAAAAAAQDGAAAAAAVVVQDGSGGSGGGGGGESGSGGDGGDGVDADAHARLLERVAAEVARLAFLADKGSGLAFVAAMERRIAAARAQLGAQLARALGAAVARRAWGAAGHALRGYAELGDASCGEAALRDALAAPLAADAARAAKAAAAADPTGGGGKARAVELAADAYLSALDVSAGPLLAALLAPGGALAAFDTLGAVLLAAFAAALHDGLPDAFSPGNPAAFHSNYTAAQRFLAALEARAATRAAVERFRASDAAAAFARRWNLAAYFSLRYQDIAGAFEAAARAPTLELAAPASADDAQQQQQQQFVLAVSVALSDGLKQASDERVLLRPLGDRFVRLACQLAARYASWLADAAAARRAAAAGGGAGGSGGASSGGALPSAGGMPPGSPPAPGGALAAAGAGAAAAGGGTAASAVGPEAWAPSVPAEELLALCCDAAAARDWVRGALSQRFAAALPGLDADARRQVDAALAAAAARVGAASYDVLAAVAAEVAERCAAVVRQLKGITATYRVTSKGPPTRHSHYASGALAPLKAVFDAPGAPQRLTDELRAALAAAVFDLVNERYRALAEELLSSVRKTESSLRRLKKGREAAAASAAGADASAAAAAAGPEMSDSDKITLQLHLDVQEHGRQAARFGLDAASAPSFAALAAAVAPPPGVAVGAAAGLGAGAAAAVAVPAATAAPVDALGQQQQQPHAGLPPPPSYG